MKKTEDKPKVPTLLELAIPVKRKPPSTSDESDIDMFGQGENSLKPPSAPNITSSEKTENTTIDMIKPSPNTKRKLFKRSKHEPTVDDHTKISQKKLENSKPSVNSNKASSTDKSLLYQRTQYPASTMTNITGSSGIYSQLNHQLGPKLETENSQVFEVSQKPRNYHIKTIRRGIPEIVSTDVKGRRIHLATPDLEINNYCVCKRSSDKKKNSIAWMFSIVTALLCVVFPLISFSADVSFFVICSDHYNETKALLNFVKSLDRQTAVATYFVPRSKHSKKHSDPGHPGDRRGHKPAPYRAGRAAPLLPGKEDLTKDDEIFEVFLAKRAVRHEKNKLAAISLFNTTPSTYELTTSRQLGTSKTTGSKTYNPLLYTGLTDCTIPIYERKPVCNNASNIQEYMSTEEAERELEKHRHVTSDVFEPVFIIGSFPSLVLCIFTRLVVMVTKHDHFLSAFVMNMACMPLQLVTGALAVHSASFHVGQNGFECWKCAVDGNCSNIDALAWLNDGVSVSLIVATIAKSLDGMAGGCILFVVLLRVIWLKQGHVSCWWYVGRFAISMASFVFCITVSTTMVLTPSVGVFRLEMMGKTAYFPGKESVCYVSMILFGMGLTAWGVSILTLFIYILYRTYVYCRIKEHISETVML